MRRHYSLGALKLGRDGTTQRNSQFHVEEAISHSEEGPGHGDGELCCVDSKLEKEGDAEAESVYEGLEANTGRPDDGSDLGQVTQRDAVSCCEVSGQQLV